MQRINEIELNFYEPLHQMKIGDTPRAISLWRELLARYKHPKIYLELVRCYISLNNKSEAAVILEDFSKAFLQHPLVSIAEYEYIKKYNLDLLNPDNLEIGLIHYPDHTGLIIAWLDSLIVTNNIDRAKAYVFGDECRIEHSKIPDFIMDNFTNKQQLRYDTDVSEVKYDDLHGDSYHNEASLKLLRSTLSILPLSYLHLVSICKNNRFLIMGSLVEPIFLVTFFYIILRWTNQNVTVNFAHYLSVGLSIWLPISKTVGRLYDAQEYMRSQVLNLNVKEIFVIMVVAISCVMQTAVLFFSNFVFCFLTNGASLTSVGAFFSNVVLAIFASVCLGALFYFVCKFFEMTKVAVNIILTFIFYTSNVVFDIKQAGEIGELISIYNPILWTIEWVRFISLGS